MTINKNNYEAFFLDYHEGNLSAEEVADLLLFVELHPELKEAFESFESIAIDNFETNEFKNKAHLKRIALSGDNDYEYALPEVDYLLISDLEKTSTTSESLQLKQLLKNNITLKKESNLYAHTVLKPNPQLLFEGKERLKKKKATLLPFYYSIAIAASIALFIGVYYFNQINTRTENIVAETHKRLNNKPMQTTFKKNETAILTTEKTNNSIYKNNIASKSTTISGNKDNSTKQKELLLLTTPDTTVIPIQTDKQSILSSTPSLVDTLINTPTKTYAEIKNNPTSIDTSNNNNDYLSIKELATQIIKETLIEERALTDKNKTSTKKLSGWDIAQFITNGISNIVGRKVVEVTPHYNDNGSITSYALKAGKFEISKAL